MHIAQGPVQRPILTSIIFIIVITIGMVSFTRLSIDLMPEITYPTISVSTSYGNIGPQEMEELVTRPIEEAIAAVQGVEEITSTSTEGNSRVRVSFAWGSDLDVAANDIRDRVDRVMGRLPDDIERPQIRKFDLSAFPIMIFGVSSNLNPLDLRQIVEDQVKYRIERVPGVAALNIYGGLMREIHVDLQAEKLKSLGLSPNDILTALRNENRNIPAGLLEKGKMDVLIRTQGEFTSLDQIRNTVITIREGTPIRIRDVAQIEDSWEEVRRLYRVNGKAGLRISVNKQSGANTVKAAEELKKEMERINRDIPQIELVPLIDTSVYIKRSINNVGNSTLVGGFLAILILFVFLRNVSSTAIIATAIPISVVATFALMYFGDFTLNIITFGGLALGIGMLVDNSIVVLENIYRHREEGMDPINSALTGTSEVWSAILASTLTTLVVFFPVIFIRGMSGIMFQQMAYVVSFSLLCSLIVALTLIPMLSSRFLRFRKPGDREHKLLQRIYDRSEKWFQDFETFYSDFLQKALNRKKWVVGSMAVLFILSVFMIRFIGVELMPAADEGEVRVNLEMEVGTRYEILDEITRQVEEIINSEVPEKISVLTMVGGGGRRSSGGHTGEVRVTLVPKAERSRSSDDIAIDLRKKLTSIPGVTIRTRVGQGLFLLRMGTGDAESITVEVRGYNLETAQALAQQVNEAVQRVNGITDTRISREEGSPEELVIIDRQKAADLGLTVSRIGEALETVIGGTYASYYREGGKEYRILVRLNREGRQDMEGLMDITVNNNRGEPVILRNVISTEAKEGPARIERKDQERIISIDANIAERDMGSVVADIRKELQKIPVPRDFAVVFGSDYEEQQRSYRELMFGLILAIFLVYLVMAGQFESFRDPFIVLFSIPMALIGVVLTMILTGTMFTMQAFIGCIMLAGIVVNNAILLVDYTNQLRDKHGVPLLEAIKTAGARRLRPIIMTTLTTALGLLPLSFGLGEGGEAQAPLARVVIGGLLSSTLITLVLIPVVYSIFEKERTRHS